MNNVDLMQDILTSVSQEGRDIPVAVVATVTSYDIATHTISAQPLPANKFPAISSIPIAGMLSQDTFIKSPLAPGDIAVLLITDSNIYNQGGGRSINNAICVGAIPTNTSSPPDCIYIKKGSSSIEIKDSGVEVKTDKFTVNGKEVQTR